MGSKNLISFAVEQGWYASQSGKPFNVHAVYGVDRPPHLEGSRSRTGAMEYMEAWLRQRSYRLTLQDMMDAVRSPVITRESAGYGQVLTSRGESRVKYHHSGLPCSFPGQPFPALLPWDY